MVSARAQVNFFEDVELVLINDRPNILNAGAFVELDLGKTFALQVEGLYSMNCYGWKYEEKMINESFAYISIPVLAKIRFGKFSIYGGYQFDMLHNATRGAEGDLRYNETETHYFVANAEKMYVKHANSIVAGADFILKFGLGFFLRYNRGLTNIALADELDSIYSENDKIYNDYANVGVLWSFGKK
jgi:hypothetical protein